MSKLKKIKEKILNNKKYILGVITGILISGTTVYAATVISATNVSYSNTSSKLSSTNVQGAIDELYNNIFNSNIRYLNEAIVADNVLSGTFKTSSPSSTQKLNISYDILQNTCKILKSTQILVCEILYDEYFIKNCFNYSVLDKISLLEKLLIKYKRAGNILATINTAIRLLDLLYRTRKQLHFYSLQLDDKPELRDIVNKKFNSVYKFLITKFPDKEYRYSKINEDYRAQIKFEKFREKYFYLYDEYIED